MEKKKGRSIQPKKAPRKKTNKQEPLGLTLKKAVFGIFILINIVIVAALIAPHIIKKEKKEVKISVKTPAKKEVKEMSPPKLVLPKLPTFEIFPKEEISKTSLPEIKQFKGLPKVAIIIDDIGYDKAVAEKLLNMGANITFSVFPYSPFGKSIAIEAQNRGYEVILHLPMEPVEYPTVDPGEGALFTSMSPNQLITKLEDALNSIPNIKGVNNHMGSKLTTNSTQLYQIFSVLKKRNLFFIDSKTSSESICQPSARLLKIPFAQRDIFLDHNQEKSAVLNQINNLITISTKKGYAVGIGHPHETTYHAILSMITEIRNKVELVEASKIVAVP
ncbi:MAG: divergent polysaccharide deacetylase family protein [Desulfobacterales bacterium]|nr:divergent polysaccharide deacetylase family protein [Desulfobacterales bacterium]